MEPINTQTQQIQLSGGSAVKNGSRAQIDPNTCFALLDEIWSKLMLLAKQLRDIMQSYNQKKQALGWDLEVNTLKKSVESINDSFQGAKVSAIGTLFGGLFSLTGAAVGGMGMTVGSAAGQAVGGIASCIASDETRKADTEKAIADLQNKGAQSYVKTLDDTQTKAREIMQQMMDMGRNLVEVLGQMLRAISR